MSSPAAEGLLLIDKPAGITSHDAVAIVRRTTRVKKVGHAGTLDPMATGLLVLGLGRATRLLRFLGDLPKTYEGTFRLGVETDTLDADGDVTGESQVAVTDAEVAGAMEAKLAESSQRPPAFSAVKVGGRKLYDAARRGEELRAEPRTIRVDRFDLIARNGVDVDFVAVVSGGTYVRVLAADVGSALGCGAHLTRLRRDAIGSFDVEDARPPDEAGNLLPVERAVAHLPRFELEPEEARVARHGSILGPAGIEGPYAVFDPDGALVAIYRDDGPKARPEMVLARLG
ncbi:MAG: tRNA pseudouridine(55) synthase TruB [Actinomycetota bacterium]|nr:tRNA pseudouridine(55) synthase TruB [Actinomycetota bacterium]